MVPLDSVPDNKSGDEVVLIAVQGEERASAECFIEGW